MSARLIDLTGRQFTQLTVIERAGSKRGRAMWLCLCSCGNQARVAGVDLRLQMTRSCGCLRRKTSAVNARNAMAGGAAAANRARLRVAETGTMAADLAAALAGAMAYWSVER